MTNFAKKLIVVGMAFVVVTGLAACGKKGKLVPPPGSTYPHQYPKPETAKPNNN